MEAARLDTQLKKGFLELCILQEIKRQDIYGYELARHLKKYYQDVDISVFYTVLRRLHKKLLVESYEGDCSGGPVRKYYRITEEGIRYLDQKKEDWNSLYRISGQLGIGM